MEAPSDELLVTAWINALTRGDLGQIPLVLFVFHNLRSVQHSLWRDVLLARLTPSKRRSLLDCWQKGFLLPCLLNSVFLVCAATARDLPFFEFRQFSWQQRALTRGFDCGSSTKHSLSRCLL